MITLQDADDTAELSMLLTGEHASALKDDNVGQQIIIHNLWVVRNVNMPRQQSSTDQREAIRNAT